MNYYLTTRNIYKCSSCSKQFSTIQGTIFHRSKIPLTKWFLCIYIFTTKKRGVSSVQMAKWLGVKQHTAWYMLHRLREALKDENEIVLSGIVEADESSVGPQIQRDTRLLRKSKKHREEQERIHGVHIRKRRAMPGYTSVIGRPKGLTKEERLQRKKDKLSRVKRTPFEIRTYIFGMIEHKGRLVMKKIGRSKQSITKEIIYPLLEKYVTRNSILITDELSLYNDTSQLFVEHLTVNHQVAYVVKGIHTNNIENAWKHFKKVIDGTYFHLSDNHFERYLNENTYRWNRRQKGEEFLFEDFIPMTIDRKVSYKELVTKDQTQQAA